MGTGREMIVWGRVTDAGFRGDGAAYDPAADRWRPVPALPGTPKGPPELFATPDGVIAAGRVAGLDAPFDAKQTGLLRLSAELDRFDPEAGTWTPLPPSQTSPRGGIGPVWTGRELVVPGVATSRTPDPLRVTARYLPDEQRWVDMPVVPVDGGWAFPAKVWAGREVLLVGVRESETAAFGYDPEADRWRRVPPPPIASPGQIASPERGTRLPAVWTGTAVLLWTGPTFASSR